MKKVLYFGFMALLTLSCNKKEEKIKTEEPAESTSTLDETAWLEKGKEIAMTSQKALGSQLMAKINEGGPIQALEFCSVKAIPITDSLSQAQEVKISRVTDKMRNPGNAANKSQLDYMARVKQQLKNGETPKGMLDTKGENPVGYYPIVTNAACLQCHGTPGQEISEETYAKIQALYPDDLAIGYKDNELRGIWVIEMLKD